MTRASLGATLGATLCGLLAVAHPAPAQSPGELHLRRVLATPIGALPPLPMLMPASRDHNYWAGRAQAGVQRQSVIQDQRAVAGGVDLQWRGGSVVGVTAGYRMAECARPGPGCTNHVMFGGRARFNLITGGPTFAMLVGDNNATTTVATDIGYGYAPDAISGRNACSVDAGIPVSISLFQRIRLLTYGTPGVVWDVRCPRGGTPGAGASTYLGAGIGLQQLGHPGFDVSVGAQRVFRRGAGVQLGITVTYVRLP